MENHPAETLTRRKKSFVPRLACRRIRLEKNNLKKISEIQNAFLCMLYHLRYAVRPEALGNKRDDFKRSV